MNAKNYPAKEPVEIHTETWPNHARVRRVVRLETYPISAHINAKILFNPRSIT